MSKLSELLPAGAGAKSAKFVASGTLASGVTVALKSNGQVEAVNGADDGVGAAVAFLAENTEWISCAFDSNLNKVVVSYKDNGNYNGRGFAVIGTVSGTSISFGNPVEFDNTSGSAVTYTACVFDPSSNKVVIAYGIGDQGKAIVGTVSGTSISFGSKAEFEGTTSPQYVNAAYDANAQKIVIAYRGVSSYGYGIVGTVSGTSISFGTKTAFSSAYSQSMGIAYDSNAQKVVIVWYGVSGYGSSIVGTVSGTSISFGTFVNYMTSGESYPNAIGYDSTAQKVVIAFVDVANSNYGTAIVGTVSGTSISFGTAVLFASKAINAISNALDVVYDSGINKVVIVFRDPNNIGETQSSVGTVSGTSLSFAPIFTIKATNNSWFDSVYDSNAGKVVVNYRTSGSSNGIVYAPGFSNNNSFVGITDQAIANTATGSVVVQGGVITNTGLIPYELSAGAQSVYKVGPQIKEGVVAYDSTNNRVVVAYNDNDVTGKAAVGTLTGTTITWGTPVQFSSHASTQVAIAYDTNAQKIVIGYKDNASSPYGGKAAVGTVSGTSISFGSPVQWTAEDMSNLAMTYDANAQKIVFAFKGLSGYTRAIVGTVSGTSISVGTPYTVLSENSGSKGITYDSTAQKVVLAFGGTGAKGKAAVGTVSGTSISFGTVSTFVSSQVLNVAVSYNVAANKTLICYQANGLNNEGKTFVATVSGTSISFGAISQFAGYVQQESVSATYDVAEQKTIISFGDQGNGSYGTSIAATVTGTTATYGTALVFYSGSTSFTSSAYSTTSSRIAVTYQDVPNNNQGAANSLVLTDALIIGTDYFVENDGSLSTTSSTVPAGRALSKTSMLLEG